MRLVSQSVDRTLTSAPNAPINFGLLFNKFLQYHQYKDKLEPLVKQDRRPLINDYQKSRKHAADILKQRHLRQAAYCQVMEKAGWRPFIVHARLTAPFVSGLGMAHPTETGLVLDHTSGMPYIPASSQKGVLRLAHLVNTLCDEQGRWLPENELEEKGIIKRGKNGEWEWREDTASKTLFGFGGDNNALAGQLIMLDAYPLTPPELGEEILNPHFADYYQGKRGPTEDQSPIPIKFLVVTQGAEFVFRVLLRTPFARAPYPAEDWKALIRLVERNLRRAITEEGMGGKTSLGFGRFKILVTEEPVDVYNWIRQQQDEEEKTKFPWRPFVRQIEAVTDWGQLKQIMENSEIIRFQDRTELAQSLCEIAKTIRERHLKNWTPERDQQITDWLAPSGIEWNPPTLAESSAAGSITPGDQAEVDTIANLADWNAWKTSGLNMENLTLPALRKLKEKFKEWSCDGKKVKTDKKQSWKKLNQLLRQGSH